jgi:hypothetical protein
MLRLTNDRAIALLELQQLIAAYFADLDDTQGLNSAAFFTEDGIIDIGNMSLRGHTEMRQFYADLIEQVRFSDRAGMRTTRHAFTNLLISFEADDQVTAKLLVIEFSASGPPPLLDAAAPTIVSDTQLRFRRTGNGEWRIAELSGRPLFAGNDPVLNALLIDRR